MRDYIMQQLRERACVRGKERTWISTLTDEQLYQVFLRLRNGESSRAIAKDIQQRWKINPGSSVHSLAQGVSKYRRRIAHLLLDRPPDSIGSPIPVAIEGNDYLEGTEGMELIARFQLERIKRMMAEEWETGVRHGALSKELHALTALTKALTKSKEWDLVHQGYDPVKQKKIERMRRRIARRFGDIMESLGEEGRNRLLEASSKLLEDLERHAFEVEVGSDGKYRLPEQEVGTEDNKPKQS